MNLRISPIKKRKSLQYKKRVSSSIIRKKGERKSPQQRKKMISSSLRRKKVTSSPIRRKKHISSKKKSNLYCGNNSLDPSIMNGSKVIGTRNKCLRMGFGAGYHSELNPNYTDDYEPIDRRKFYCGDKEYLPNGYDAIGNLPICLRKGFGMGVRKKYLELAR